jgi:hypothetical protein
VGAVVTLDLQEVAFEARGDQPLDFSCFKHFYTNPQARSL